MEKTGKVVTLENEIEAQLIHSILEERNIPHIVHTYHRMAYDGLFQLTGGWGHIEALPRYHDEIISVYKSIKRRETD